MRSQNKLDNMPDSVPSLMAKSEFPIACATYRYVFSTLFPNTFVYMATKIKLCFGFSRQRSAC